MTGSDIAAIQAIGTRFNEFGSELEAVAPGGVEVSRERSLDEDAQALPPVAASTP